MVQLIHYNKYILIFSKKKTFKLPEIIITSKGGEKFLTFSPL